MPLSAGDKLGPYQIVAPLGAGGMGEVYRARDLRIGREVAVKVSAEQFTERSEREARAAAALNHPNICTIHDVGPNYLVMELVEGEAPRGPLPLATALHYARQIGDALDAAHQKGIVHRDLKPANIKITTDGTVKVLDFGLAKMVSPDSGEPIGEHLSNSPTMPIGATQAGMILGTAAYMAPEQARGKPVEKRADIWAFGVVLYELITGRRPFGPSTVAGSLPAAASDDGEDAASILAAVIQSEPRWDAVPASVRPLLESCLQKDPRKRLRDIGDAWKLVGAAPAMPSPVRSGAPGWIAAGLLAIVAATALWAPWRSESPPPLREPMRFEVDAGADVMLPPLASPTFSSIVISPDGTRVVYVGSVRGGPPKLLTRRLDQTAFTELAGTEGASQPFFSRDGQWVGFWSGDAVFKVAVEGGAATKLADLANMTGGDWNDAGDLIVGTGDSPSGVLRMSPTGVVTPLVELAQDEWFHTHPRVLPGARHVLFEVVTRSAPGSPTIDVASLADRQRKTIVRGGGSPRYLESGHLLYANRSTLFAVPFDLERLEVRGAPVRMLDDVAFDTVAGGAQYDVSRTGIVVYRRYPGDRSASTVQWAEPSGKSTPLLARAAVYETPRLSPDGQRIAITVKDGVNYDIWVYEPARDGMTRLTRGGTRAGNPVWTPDGQYVIFGLLGSGIWWARADGGGQPQPLLATSGVQLPTGVSRDTKRLAYFQPAPPQIWTVTLAQDGGGLKAGTPTRFLTTKSVDVDAMFSPDGRWLAYASTESGPFEVYVRAIGADGTAGTRRWLISNNGGTSPRWSADGRDLLYLAGDRIMAVGYTASGESFEAGKPRVWAANVLTTGGFDPSPDGKRVAVSVPTSTAPANTEQSIVFILNFFEELRRRVPVSR
jgi:Tol biopolymer transport system component